MNPTPEGRAATRRRGLTVLLATVVAVLAALVVVPAGTAAADTAGPPAGRYTPIAPVRVYDSGTSNPFGPGETRTIDLSKAFTAPASAVVINLTAAGGTQASFQTVYPAGIDRPLASSLNEPAGIVRANSVTVAVGQGGSNQNDINLYNDSGSVRLVVDVTGWYGKGGDASNPGTTYVPLTTPVRLFDSRLPNSRGVIQPLGNTAPYNLGTGYVDYGPGMSNSVIKAVAINLTVTQPTGPGYLTLWDGVTPTPSTSTINFGPGQTVANLAIVPVHCIDSTCSKLAFAILNVNSPATHVIADIVGAYAVAGTPGGTVLAPAAPQRILDTRQSSPFAVLGPAGVGGVTGGTWAGKAKAAVLNVTAVTPTQLTYLTVFPTNPKLPMPGVSSLNAAAGDTIPNAAMTTLGSSGAGFSVYNSQGWSQVLVDMGGVFYADPGTSTTTSSGQVTAAAAPAGGADSTASTGSGAPQGALATG